MMLSNAFQSRKMESMGSRNLGKLVMESSFPAWSWSDGATTLQESVLARPGGGPGNCNSTPLFLALFCLFDTCTKHHRSGIPGPGVAGRHGEGHTPDPAELVLG